MANKKWDKFKKTQEQSEETTAVPTMNLRCVVSLNGNTIEQLIEYRNNKGMLVGSEWIAIPTVYAQE